MTPARFPALPSRSAATLAVGPRCCGDQRGVALMLVLWLIVVLGAIAAGVVAASRTETNLTSTIRSRTVARYAAESGVAAAIVQLKEMFRAAETPEAKVRVYGRFEERLARAGVQALGAARYQVAVADLNARIDLNNSDRAAILGLFEQFVGRRRAEELAEALRDWKDEDDITSPDGAEAPEYLRAGSPFVPPNRPLLRLDELTRIKGFTDSIANLLAPYITVYGDGRVNVNTAPRPVLAAVPTVGEVGADMFVSRREQGEVFESLHAVRNATVREGGGSVGFQPGDLTTMPSRVLVISRGWEEGRPLTHEVQAVFQLDGLQSEEGARLQVRHWMERDR